MRKTKAPGDQFTTLRGQQPERQQLPFPATLDNQGSLAAAFNDVKLTPTTAFIFDTRGRIVRNIVGERDSNSLHAMPDEQLGRPG